VLRVACCVLRFTPKSHPKTNKERITHQASRMHLEVAHHPCRFIISVHTLLCKQNKFGAKTNKKNNSTKSWQRITRARAPDTNAL
jgi:hypothetical protein